MSIALNKVKMQFLAVRAPKQQEFHGMQHLPSVLCHKIGLNGSVIHDVSWAKFSLMEPIPLQAVYVDNS